MKLKNLKILNFLFLGIFIFTIGCEEVEIGNEFLSKPPELDYTLDSAFANPQRAKEVLWNAYMTLPFEHPGNSAHGAVPGQQGGVGHTPRWALTDMFNHGDTWDGMAAYLNGTYNAEAANSELNWDGVDKYGWLRQLGWRGIRTAYIFLDHVDEVPDMGQEERQRLKAEAKMIIATQYVHMFRHYGGILWVDHAYKPGEKADVKRLTVMQSVDTITTMIDDAMQHLPFKLEDPERWSGRFTSAGAMGLKVKLLEFAAAPLFNSDEPYMEGEAADKELVWTGGYKESLWVRLKDVCEKLIQRINESSYYGLVNTGNPLEDYRSAYYDRGTGETLLSFREYFEFHRWSVPENIPWMTLYPWWRVAVPQHNLATVFPMQSGKSIDDPTSAYEEQNPFANRDPRMYETLTFNGSRWTGRKAEMWIGGRERPSPNFRPSYTGYRAYKWIFSGHTWGPAEGKIMQWPFIRIPEVYYAYAEALTQLNGNPQATGALGHDAFYYVNLVRDRVNVGGIEEQIIGTTDAETKADITKEQFIDALLNERVCELIMEDIRWYDMVRYKRKDLFTKPNYRLDITLSDSAKNMENFSGHFQNIVDFSNQAPYFNYEVKELQVGELHWEENFSPRYYLSAFPSDEVRKGYGLIQNPGYEIE